MSDINSKGRYGHIVINMDAHTQTGKAKPILDYLIKQFEIYALSYSDDGKQYIISGRSAQFEEISPSSDFPQSFSTPRYSVSFTENCGVIIAAQFYRVDIDTDFDSESDDCDYLFDSSMDSNEIH